MPANKARGLAALPGGVPYVLGRAPFESIRYTCAACRHPVILTVVEWRALPTRRLADLEAAKMGDIILRDMAGVGISRDQALQLEGAGLDLVEVHRMPQRGLDPRPVAKA